ncbi:TPA: proline--tRNA ligase [Candidatus Micrarchaeota archaeon]|nr:MAG: proline--tRNA ligase [Candidatus Micrarchaeota archaeon CG1_02_51_15]HII39391.1 proline--tRNA ligase [Candidatus Micrarchaeota archaeon]
MAFDGFDFDKEKDFSTWYSEVVKRAELCDLRYNVKGFVVFRPWCVMSFKKMYAAFEKELEASGHRPALFPALVPEENFLKEKEHVEGFAPDLFWVTEVAGNKLGERLAMRPTSETAMYKMYSLWIQGLSDLPLKIYQSCQVWRCETKATRPFIRSREFHWIEAHDVFATMEEAEAQVRTDMETTERVMHLQFGVPFIYFKRPEWDKFPGAVETFGADSLMPDGKTIQQPSTHLLGQNFAKAFDVSFLNSKGEREFGWQTCYGPAISRIYASVISVHGDNKGLVLPFDLAPVQVVVIPVQKKGLEEKIVAKAKAVAASLRGRGFSVECDCSTSTPGFKYNYWELRGVPLRVEVGAREMESGEFVVARRDTGEKEKVKEMELPARLNGLGVAISDNLRLKADAWFAKQLHCASSMEELAKALDKGGFVKVPLCSVKMDGKACAEKIKAETVGDVRGTRFGGKDKPVHSAVCVACGKPADEVVFVARQY